MFLLLCLVKVGLFLFYDGSFSEKQVFVVYVSWPNT